MFKNILVPLDGSQLAESVLPVVSFLAQKLTASVTLLHVIEKDAPDTVHGESHLNEPEQATTYLKTIAKKVFPAKVTVKFHVHTAYIKDVAKSIVEHQDELRYDLVVMCTHGQGKTSQLLFGSIAQDVIHKGAIPVMVINTGRAHETRPFFCQSILLPIDETATHERALPVAQELAKAFKARLNLVMVIPTFSTVSGKGTSTARYLPGTTSAMLELSVDDAGQYLLEMQTKLEKAGLKVTAQVLRGDPANAIVDAAKKLEVDFIVMGTHGKSGMDALFSGSVANKVCSQSQVPLLLVPERG
jgi:nucleotide-binding universal stress UspA family protein